MTSDQLESGGGGAQAALVGNLTDVLPSLSGSPKVASARSKVDGVDGLEDQEEFRKQQLFSLFKVDNQIFVFAAQTPQMPGTAGGQTDANLG